MNTYNTVDIVLWTVGYRGGVGPQRSNGRSRGAVSGPRAPQRYRARRHLTRD